MRASALEATEYLSVRLKSSTGTAGSTILGTILALLAAGGYTAYQVLFRWCFGHLKSDAAFLAHFGAWISIWCFGSDKWGVDEAEPRGPRKMGNRREVRGLLVKQRMVITPKCMQFMCGYQGTCW